MLTEGLTTNQICFLRQFPNTWMCPDVLALFLLPQKYHVLILGKICHNKT